jgi:hypothetical protein
VKGVRHAGVTLLYIKSAGITNVPIGEKFDLFEKG